MTDIHCLDLVDRGLGHKHRWWAQCSCGWVGVYRRRKKEATDLYRSHVNGEISGNNQRRTLTLIRPLTPRADLPEQLR